MRYYKNVAYTKKIQLFFLLISTVAIWITTLIILEKLFHIEFLSLIIPFVSSTFFYIWAKKKIIFKSDFKLTHKKLEWDNEELDFNKVQSYKIHWIQGADINFKLKNGKHIKISANDNFCDAKEFVGLCRDIDHLLQEKYSNKITRKNTFYETRYGYYFTVIMTILVIFLTIYKIIMNQEISSQKLYLIIFSLGIVWSGVRWKSSKNK